MILDQITSRVLFDTETRVTLEITAVSNGVLTTTNSVALVANTVKFANSSLPCTLDCVGIQYAVAIANGWVSLEFLNASGNSTFAVFGRQQAGHMSAYMTNANTAVPGDINVNVHNMATNDSFTLVLQLNKNDVNGSFANVSNPWNAIPSNLY